MFFIPTHLLEKNRQSIIMYSIIQLFKHSKIKYKKLHLKEIYGI